MDSTGPSRVHRWLDGRSQWLTGVRQCDSLFDRSSVLPYVNRGSTEIFRDRSFAHIERFRRIRDEDRG